MTIIPYVTDNPYRLLGLGSATTQSELRRQANAADKAARVGILPDSGLMQLLGAECLPECADRVRTLGSDPLQRTIYRLFWPLDYQPRPEYDGTEADLARISVLSAEPRHVLHVEFLSCWIRYFSSPDPKRAASLLDAAESFYYDCDLTECLTSLLNQDGEDFAADDWSVAVAADDAVVEDLLKRLSRQAAEWWGGGAVADATALVQSIIDSGFDEDDVDKALAQLTAEGDLHRARLEEVLDNAPEWTARDLLYDGSDVATLLPMALALQEHLPSARQWLDVAYDRIRQMVIPARNHAIDTANNASNYALALNILEHIKTLPLPDDVTQIVDADLTALRENIRHEAAWKDIEPLESPPSLRTTNGIGCKLYGRQDFPERAGWYFATYYFVLLFLPIFPIRRYLVSRAEKGGWYFHGQAPLKRSDFYPVGGTLALLGLFVLYINVSASRTPTPSSTYTDSNSSYTPPASVPIDPVDPQRQKLMDRYDALKADIDSKHADIESRRTTLNEAVSSLRSDRLSLDMTDEAAVDKYNAAVDRLKGEDATFGADVNAYNDEVNELNSISQKLNKP